MTKKVACVAGGTSGIGRDLTKSLIDAGYFVIAVGKGRAHADELRGEVETKKMSCSVVTGDLRDPSFANEIVSEIAREHGKLDVLVNCAGTISKGGIEAEDFDEWRLVMSTNLDSAFCLTKAALELLRKGSNPSIVNISSVCSLRPCTSLSYSVSKAGTDMFTKVLARELAPQKIRVNSVNPGVVRTNLQYSAGLFDDEKSYGQWADQMMKAHPLGRIGNTADVASAVMFLISESATWVTGAILSVDGGRAIA